MYHNRAAHDRRDNQYSTTRYADVSFTFSSDIVVNLCEQACRSSMHLNNYVRRVVLPIPEVERVLFDDRRTGRFHLETTAVLCAADSPLS